MSRDNSTKFLEEWCKLIYTGFFPNPKQVGIGNVNRQCRKMNKGDHKDIIKKVVTAIGDSDSNAENNKTEVLRRENRYIVTYC